MWRRPGVLLWILPVWLATGCQQVHVQTPESTAPALQAYRDFTFTPDRTAAPAENRALTAAVRQVVQTSLVAKGYQHVSREEADLLVAFYTNVGVLSDLAPMEYSAVAWERAHPSPFSQPAAPSGPDVQSRAVQRWPAGYHHDNRGYLDMLVVVDIVDPEKNELVWRGWMRQPERPGTLNAEEIAEAVRTVLTEFPAREVKGTAN